MKVCCSGCRWLLVLVRFFIVVILCLVSLFIGMVMVDIVLLLMSMRLVLLRFFVLVYLVLVSCSMLCRYYSSGMFGLLVWW